MKKVFYIFRHGETELNAKKVWQGTSANPNLNGRGREQAAELGQKIKNYGEYNGALYRVVAKYDVHNITGCVLHNGAMRTRNMFCSQIC